MRGQCCPSVLRINEAPYPIPSPPDVVPRVPAGIQEMCSVRGLCPLAWRSTVDQKAPGQGWGDQQQLFGWMDCKQSSELTVLSPAPLSLSPAVSWRSALMQKPTVVSILGCPVLFQTPLNHSAPLIAGIESWCLGGPSTAG